MMFYIYLKKHCKIASVKTKILGKTTFNSIKNFEDKKINFEKLLQSFSKDLVAHNADILVSSFGFYKNESFKTLSNSWEKKEDTDDYNNIVAFFDKGIEYVNNVKALSLTRYIFDHHIQCLKILVKTDDCGDTEDTSF